eukprot:gene13967-14083_t
MRGIEKSFPGVRALPTGDVILRVDGLNRGAAIKDVSFTLRKGEILGFAGLMGAGRTEVARAIFGADAIDSGEIHVHGQKQDIKSPKDAVRLGLAYLSEDRKRFGLVTPMSVRDNVTMASWQRFTSGKLWMQDSALRKTARDYVELLKAAKAKSGLLTVAAMQKAVAFVVLIALLLFFTFSNPNFMSQSNMVGIMQATAVNGVLAVACTFVIASAGIDLSVGTLMTFTAVMSGVFLTFWGLPMWLGVILVLLVGAAVGATSGLVISQLKIPPFIATLGMMLVLKGLSLVISGVHPIYFNDTPNYSMLSADSFVSYFIPSFEVPNGVLILFGLVVTGIIIMIAVYVDIVLRKKA